MDKENFKKGIEGVREVRMSNQESNLVWEKLESYTVSNPLNIKIKSPWYTGVVFFATSRTGAVVFSVLFVSLISVNSLFLASSSLPGDVLYPLKVDVMEPIQYTMAVDSVSKTNILLNNLDTRIKEVELLQTGGRLSGAVQTDVENRLKESTKKIVETSKNNKIINKSKNLQPKQTEDVAVKKSNEPTMMMMVSSEISTTTLNKEQKPSININDKAKEIIKNTRESIERIKKNRKSSKRFIEVAEKSLREAEDSLKDD